MNKMYIVVNQDLKMGKGLVSAGVKVPIEWIELYNKQAKDISEVIK